MAKGLLARTSDDPTEGATLDSPETIAALIAATRDAVGEAPRPIEYLHSYAGAADAGWWDAVMRKTGEKANANNVYSSAPLDAADAVAMVTKHASLSAVLLVSRARLEALAAYGDAVPKTVRAEIAREAKRPGAFAYVWRRSRHAFLFVIVADDANGAEGVADALFRREQMVSGVVR